jgi:hypothetical protein
VPVVGAGWVSQWIDENNDGIDEATGKRIIHPAPNFGTGIGSGEESSVGRGDKGCLDSFICNILISDQAPQFKALFYLVPGFKSFADFHDTEMMNSSGSEKGGGYKAVSIIPYIPISYYGAIGTYLNSTTNDFNKPSGGANE